MTAKFDPVAWYAENVSSFGAGRDGYNDMLRALAAEAAKQQAIRDAEICRLSGETGSMSDDFSYGTKAGDKRARELAQAIEREAGL